MIEEIKIDDIDLGGDYGELDLFRYIIDKSKNEGPQTGVPWSKDVFNYIFESNVAFNLENLPDCEFVDIDLQDRF